MSVVEDQVADDEIEATAETPEPDETETQQAEGDDTPEPEPEPEPVALTEKEIEAVFKKLEKNATSNANAISRILGEEAQDLIHCALCAPATPGFYFAAYLDDEVRANVLAAIGQADANEYRVDPEALTCELCDGYGVTLTGSRVENQRTKVCPECKGNGWTNQQQRTEYGATQGAKLVVAAYDGEQTHEPAPTTTMPQFDAWQRPFGHELYGKNPVYLTADERARDVIA